MFLRVLALLIILSFFTPLFILLKTQILRIQIIPENQQDTSPESTSSIIQNDTIDIYTNTAS
jgi:hypothetical protein